MSTDTTTDTPAIAALRARLKARVKSSQVPERESSEAASMRRQEQQEDEARMLAWRALHRWEPVAYRVRAQRYTCRCGTVRSGLIQSFLREKDNESQEGRGYRLKPVLDMAIFGQSALPREWEWVDSQVDICTGCTFAFGFSPESSVR